MKLENEWFYIEGKYKENFRDSRFFLAKNLLLWLIRISSAGTCRQFSSGIELPAADEVGQLLLALLMQTVKEVVLAIESESLGGNSESNDFEIRELGDNPTTRSISMFITTISGEILADLVNSNEICYEVAHMQYDRT